MRADILFCLDASILFETNHMATSTAFDVRHFHLSLFCLKSFTFYKKIFFLITLIEMFHEIIIDV